MILKLSKDKKLTFYRKNPIYIGEKDFDTIEVLIPFIVDNNETNNLNFILHLVNKNGEYLHINLDKEIKGDIVVGSTKISSTITNEAQNFFLYLELIKENNEIIGKTNCVEITIEPLPDEDTRIIPKEEYEEIIDELTEIIQENTEAMNRINGFQDGKSAYEIAIDNGFSGTEAEWLLSLKGADGTQGAQGIQGEKGDKGDDGFSPTVSTTSEYLRTRVEITDVNGMQYFYINDGESVKSAIIDANGDLKITIQGKPSGVVHPMYPERIYNVGHVVGADGYSPTATVTQTQNGATVSITDKNGTTTANISNGVNGSDYILTAQDKSDIADLVLAELPTTQGVQYGNAGN